MNLIPNLYTNRSFPKICEVLSYFKLRFLDYWHYSLPASQQCPKTLTQRLLIDFHYFHSSGIFIHVPVLSNKYIVLYFYRAECLDDSECRGHLVCSNNKCIDPCAGTCGANSNCEARNHLPVCSCPPGHTGDPFVSCRRFDPGKINLSFHEHSFN